MAVQYKDYYESLGVPRTASDADIKKSFRKLAREFHPDVAKDKKKAEEKFKEINEAYEVLGDPAKRKKYDELGANWKSGAEFRPPPGWKPWRTANRRGRRFAADARWQQRRNLNLISAAPASAISSSNFSGRGCAAARRIFRLFQRRRGGAAARGRDIEGDILVTLEEAARGAVRTVTVRHDSRAESHQVKIPAGVMEGQRLRLAGRGEHGSGGGVSGDLYLRVRLARHPDFDVDGHDLIYEAELAPWDAVLGAEISVPTLEGRVNIKIPAGTPSGQKLRVRSRGLPNREGGKGDLFVVAKIVVPAKISPGERKLWEQLKHDSKFDPRQQ